MKQSHRVRKITPVGKENSVLEGIGGAGDF